ncbi:type 1 glutamine amidotransferase [Vreelandella boliviensis]|uniref:Glutamine amidotransferase n=1 Tax=Vreelandella boliviensis LC1 TaxID=1072583 RepID=A0A265E0B7_9GAMM|nr:type 1 glutamine amidotransferase [Halomonas boliviensis]EHJ93027.1 Putative glutamine amidotransferase-like protein yfeJ [Halomonas boliviensis LC1]OZT75022.1 glutamine amidotransferase [Halomonas boliviensis LC1]
MHIHLLQHGPDHGPARLTDWLTSMGHSYTVFHLYAGELTPRPSESDALIVLDGPEALLSQSPAWFKAEDKLINRYLDGQKPLLGIGLGAHRIALALGSVVAPGTYTETGWHTVTLAPESSLDLPETFTAFMWHSYVFSLPDDAFPLGGSEAAPLQGFAWDKGRVIGLLCHLEATVASVKQLLGTAEWPSAPPSAARYVQDVTQILEDPNRFIHLAPQLDRLMTQWLKAA